MAGTKSCTSGNCIEIVRPEGWAGGAHASFCTRGHQAVYEYMNGAICMQNAFHVACKEWICAGPGNDAAHYIRCAASLPCVSILGNFPAKEL